MIFFVVVVKTIMLVFSWNCSYIIYNAYMCYLCRRELGAYMCYLCRRELGEKLIDAREKGLYASMHYNKLIIENEIYKYDEGNQEIYRVGYTRGRPGTNHSARDLKTHVAPRA